MPSPSPAASERQSADYEARSKDVEAAELDASCVRGRHFSWVNIDPGEVDEVVVGHVGQVGPDAYNARRVALGAGMPTSTTAMNVNRLWLGPPGDSHRRSVDHDGTGLDRGAGGNESMSRQPSWTAAPATAGAAMCSTARSRSSRTHSATT